jgi:hypothetical protein
MTAQTFAICLVLGLAFNRLVQLVYFLIDESQVISKASLALGAVIITAVNFGIGFVILKLYQLFFGV